MPGKPAVTLALVDDHPLFRKGLISLITMLDKDYIVLFEAANGADLQKKLNPAQQPDILLLDINMPGMDGFATVNWLNDNYPLIKILIVSMIEKEEPIIRMLKLGVKGYLCKDVEPEVLAEALYSVLNKGFYYTDFITGKLVHSLQSDKGADNMSSGINIMTAQEQIFLKHACSELTYNEIARKMFLSPKTIDGYRNSLFEKLNVKSRVGLALFAVKHSLVQI